MITTAPPPSPANPTVEWSHQRSAVVTGVVFRRGTGRVLDARPFNASWAVAVLGLDGDAAQTTVIASTHATGHPVFGVVADVSAPGSVAVAATHVEEGLPPVMDVTSLTGISSSAPFSGTTAKEWHGATAVKARGTFLTTQAFAAGMIERRPGRTVNVTSVSAQRGGGTYSKSAHSAYKAANICFARAVAREVRCHGITVNAVSPGLIYTEITGGLLDDERRAAMTTSGRVGAVGDIATLTAYLMGSKAGYETTAVYDANGGL